MKKIKITNRVYDTVEKTTLLPNQEVERSNDRADVFIDKGFAVAVEAPKEVKKPKKKK